MKEKEKYEGKSVQEIFKEITSKLDYNEVDPFTRIELVEDQIANNDELKDYVNWDDGSYFKTNFVNLKVGKNGDPLSDEVPYSKNMEKLSTYILKQYKNFENANYLDYPIMSKYRVEKDKEDGKNKMVIGINTDVFNEKEDLPKSVINGHEMHVDMLDEQISSNKINKSEDVKRQERRQDVLDNLDNYPELKERYDTWKELGLKYGLDESYTNEEKESYRQYLMNKFAEEENMYSPKQRLYLINKMYNADGYDLTILLNSLKDTIYSNPVERSFDTTREQDDVLEETLNLGDVDHVSGLLSIMKEDREYLPVYQGLEVKYLDNVESFTYWALEQFRNAIMKTDLSNEEKEIVLLLMDKHKVFNIYNNGVTVDPYKILNKFINEKYGKKRSKAQLVKFIHKTIARKIANTYQAIQDGIDSKECGCCGKEKLLINDNWAKDNKGKNGFRSECKACNNIKRKKYA
ncbi:hypothetical protein MUN88_17250 [Gracilibacillus caseinilyticus]|uniref:Uncharacterized protein n=1 Tax=Gracilibacillus caseinilyticus TaxID=2932256 RepID=A0ABY4EU35_9BACI|nr:hypothetical protein [Gracilibacillus caseinilyticus]UOQ47779.1 hypothetical protein MUN88_17250 [Gracilibacillus caseinilyticus]